MSIGSNHQKSNKENNLAWRSCLMLLAVCVGVMACSSVSYKRGANPGTMAEDEGLCRAGNATEDAFRRCMRDKGWFFAGGATIEKTVNDTKSQQPTALSTQDVEVGRPSTATTEVIAPVTTHNRSEDELVQPVPHEASDPQTTKSAASWWKFGGTANGLDLDIAGCAAELGETRRPGSGTTSVSNVMSDCLKARGWYGIGK